MPIPAREEKRQDIATAKKLINLPRVWKIEYDVRPFLEFDLGYRIDAKEKVINFLCYSPAYPASFYCWIDKAAKKINKSGFLN